MKIGFSTRVCPEWDLTTVVTKAAELGYDGVELGAMQGTAHLPAVGELTSDPDAVQRMFTDKGVELVCLGTGETLVSWNVRETAQSLERILDVVRLASRLGCPFVRVPIGEVPKGDSRDRTLSRLASMFESLAVPADRHRVTLLVENGGDYAGSEDIWFVIDHVAHPAVAACWNPCPAMTRLERPTISIPRLGTRIKLVRVCDGTFDERGRFGGYAIPGKGSVDFQRMIDLLRGIIYRGYLVFDWPKAVVADLPDAGTVLPTVRTQLREWIDAKTEPLTAYRGDKKAVRLNLPDSEASPQGIAKAGEPAN